jgi:hypothetical protein
MHGHDGAAFYSWLGDLGAGWMPVHLNVKPA